MEYSVVGWPSERPTLELDHREFAYAGKFVMSNTGKAVARDGETGLVAAVAFSEDRTDPDALWLRYITTRQDRRGEAIGPRLAAYTTARVHDRGYDRVVIAVNNPFAYHALSKAGFGFTGEHTGLAELVLEHPNDRARYHEGLTAFQQRELSPDEHAFIDAKTEEGPPPTIEPPR